MHNIRVTVNGKELPIIDGKVTLNTASVVEPSLSASDWNAALKRMREPIHCTGYLTDSEGNYQPVGPVVEGSIEPPLQG